ncbi:ATP-binding cassette domain-containing protein [Microbacterium elymi]|uniref:ATP-binding cassette domain-containing protein n=1 Tax=Microbacterium elymi TaxID=2909587 RepID=A0ABY5NHE1_9MICO|nr:ATP-binding cassette domain-containing protein [Microbacterium elymi]
MPEGQVLEFAGLSKRFGAVLAVDGFSARVEPGAVTGFLGPNGAGKTTTLRILLGLVQPSAGTATVGGVPYEKLRHPLQTVGAVLEASSFHPGRSAANHLKAYAQAAGLPACAGRRRPGHGGPGGCRRAQDRRVFAGDASATRARRGAAGRPGSARPGRAVERPGPRGHHLDARPAARARPPGTHRAGLVAPARRGAADRRSAADHLARPAGVRRRSGGPLRSVRARHGRGCPRPRAS